MKITIFATHLTSFLTSYLPTQRNIRPNTIKSYRDTFVLFLRYYRDIRGLRVEGLELEEINPLLVKDFLDYLEKERHCKIRTRNLRLTALHAFFRYLQTEEPELMWHCQRILTIPMRRCANPTVEYLLPDDLAAIFSEADLTTCKGRRDAVLMSLLYDTGARVQELIDLSIHDVRLECPAQICLCGKGGKKRAVPLMDSTVELLREYLQEHSLIEAKKMNNPVFCNRFGRRLSRSGVRYILEKYTKKAQLTRKSRLPKVSPHIFRHTKAMHLLQSGNPLVVIRDFLGHADIKSTEIYARADLNMKRRALHKASDKSPILEVPFWQKDKGLLDWLRAL